MSRPYMDTGETYLFDVDDVMQMMAHVTQEVTDVIWANHRASILTNMLEHLFYGSRLSGERDLERCLMSYGLEELAAIKAARRLYSVLMAALHLDEQGDLGGGLYDYQLHADIALLVVRRGSHDGFTPMRLESLLDPDIYLHEIERSIQSGDFVPERLRRLVSEHRH